MTNQDSTGGYRPARNVGALAPTLAALLVCCAVALFLRHARTSGASEWELTLEVLVPVAAFAGIFALGVLEDPERPSPTLEKLNDLVPGIAAMLASWSLPILVIVWVFNPANYKRAATITCFFGSLVFALWFYHRNRHKFRGPADVVGFFTGVCLGAPAVIQILL